MFFRIKHVIDHWDPMGFLQSGRDPDSYDRISRLIAGRIRMDSSAEDIADIMSKVFTKHFGGRDFSVQNCAETARNIYSEINAISMAKTEPLWKETY